MCAAAVSHSVAVEPRGLDGLIAIGRGLLPP